MILGDLGLTQAEVDSIMADVAGQPQMPPGGGVLPGTPNTNSTVTTTGNTTGPAVKVQTQTPPTIGPTAPKVVAAQAAAAAAAKKGSTGVAPAIVGATTGFIFGGPPGALIGAAGMWLLNKAITPKTK